MKVYTNYNFFHINIKPQFIVIVLKSINFQHILMKAFDPGESILGVKCFNQINCFVMKPARLMCQA